MDILAIITARGGSLSIPKKNTVPLAGKPLLAWTVEAAQAAPSLDRIILSSDDSEIQAIARQWQIEVPFTRPAELARPDTPGIAPLIHAVRWLEEVENYRPDYVLLLQPTSPLRTGGDIEAAIRLALERQADAVVSVSPIDQHPYWMKTVTPDGWMHDFFPDGGVIARRQDLPPLYALNGAIYLVRRTILLERQTFYTDRTLAYIMPPERALDVDTPWDLHLCNLILQDRLRQ